MIIREAKTSDLEKIIALAVDSVVFSQSPFRDTPLEEVKRFRQKDLSQLFGLLGQPHVGVFVAEEEGEFVGHVIVLSGVVESVSGEEQGWIIDLSVKPSFWGKGISKALSEKAEAFVLSKGLKYLGLGVTSQNKRAVRFYEKMGFVEERKRMIKRLV
jgi:ribosomal protein S18 acetylase RimI-like enzyme